MRQKYKLVVILIILKFSVTFGFIPYPFSAENLLNKFLKSLENNEKFDVESNLMKFAIQGEECSRICRKNDQKVCFFKFNLEYYQVLGGACNECVRGNKTDCFNEQCVTADGFERGFLSVNRQLPGPPIQVCKGDIVVVDVNNQMDGSGTTIHWHGLRQRGTPFSDGTPYVSQCPIDFGTTFRYTFYAEDLGTHFYHSHAGLHKSNGIYGAIVVRSTDDNDHLYDYDPPSNILVVSDWMHQYSEQYFPGLTSKLSLFKSILINGRGRFMNRTTLLHRDSPIQIYNVIQNKRYRFRLINAASNVCAFTVQIENHKFDVVASDGSTFKPIKSDTLYITSGERYDIIVNTTNKKVRDYFIRIKALVPCQLIDEVAILRYHKKEIPKDAKEVDYDSREPPDVNVPYPMENLFNAPQIGNGTEVAKAESYKNDQRTIRNEPDHSFKIFLGTPKLYNKYLFQGNNTYKYMLTSTQENFNNIGVMNNISISFPDFSLVSQPEDIDEEMFCDWSKLNELNRIGNSSVYQCVHRLKVKLGSIVELLIYDVEDSRIHPFHLHGHKFYVMDMQNFEGVKPTPEQIINENLPKDRKLKNKNPPFKDSILIPNPGYVRVKFHADNPGFWIGHCHFDWHLGIGMAVIFQVGELDEMKKRPKEFGYCRSFKPNYVY